MHRDMSMGIQPVGGGKCLFTIVQHLLDHMWNTVSGFGPPSTRRVLINMSESSRQPTRWSGDWSM